MNDKEKDWRFDLHDRYCAFEFAPQVDAKGYRTLLAHVSDLLKKRDEAWLKKERAYWINIFDSKPEREREFPCDNCTQKIARIEIDRVDTLLTEISIDKKE